MITIKKNELKNLIKESVDEGISKVLNYDIKLLKKINYLGEEELSFKEEKEFDEIKSRNEFVEY